jgi:hypothetical protein
VVGVGGEKMYILLWLIILALFVLWLVGLGMNWGSWLWIFFVIAVILLLFNLFTGRRVVT